MNKFLKIKMSFAAIAIFAVICTLSAGWVVAQAVQQTVKPAVAPPPAAGAQEAGNLATPQNTQKIFGSAGRPDPFIPVLGAKPARTLQAGGLSAAKEAQAGGVSGAGASGAGFILTAIIFSNGDRYAIVRYGDQNYILKEGAQKFDYKISRITRDKVTITGKTGSTDLRLEEYVLSAKDKPLQTQSMPQSPMQGIDSKSLVPPPMQPPVQNPEQTVYPQGTSEGSGGQTSTGQDIK